MEKTMEKTIYQLVGKYSNAVGRFGPDSEQVRQFRVAHADNAELMEYADALDRIKRHLGGSGIDKTETKSENIISR